MHCILQHLENAIAQAFFRQGLSGEGLQELCLHHVSPGCCCYSSGIVEHIGLSRLALRGDPGDVNYLPLSALYDNAFSIASSERAYPVETQVQCKAGLTREVIESIEHLAALCPYRDLRSAVRVIVNNNERLVLVRFRARSEEAAHLAETYIKVGYEQNLQGQLQPKGERAKRC